MKPRIVVVAGTRPEIIKMAPVIRAFEGRNEARLFFILSGQHYDYEMSQAFIEELELPKPDENLEVGSGTHAEQTAKMLVAYEEMMKKYEPNIVLAEGDTNTVAAVGLAAIKLRVPFGHMEAGLRSYDRTMPEEINRVIAGVTAELHFAPTPRAAINLLYEGIPPAKIFVTGNTIVDACLKHIEVAKRKSKICEELGLHDPMITVTAHRAENVDDAVRLREIARALIELKSFQVIFPVHPRTKKRLKQFDIWNDLSEAEHVILTESLGYLDFLRLLSCSRLVMTDSGGVQEEALTLGIPCLTMRGNTERPETVEVAANILTGAECEKIVGSANRVLLDKEFAESMKSKTNPLGDGEAGERIANIVVDKCLDGIKVEPSEYYETGSACFKLIRVDSKLAGVSIGEFHKRNSQFLVTLVYDEEGKPRFPYPDLTLMDGWHCRLFGLGKPKRLR